jgi:MFS family permease
VTSQDQTQIVPRPWSVLVPYSLFAFGYNAQWTGLLLLVVPRAVLHLVGSRHSAQALSLLVVGGSVLTVVLLPFMGALSDRLRTPMGRRRPVILAGSAVNLLGLLLMATASHYVPFAVGDLLTQVGSTAAWAAYQGLLPDLVPAASRGTASGLVGLMEELAIVVGALLPTVLPGAFFPAAMALYAAFTLPLFLLTEPEEVPPLRPLRQALRELSSYRDFFWVFITRFLVILGFVTLEDYLFYYVKFTLGAPNPSAVVTEAILAVTVASAVSVLAAGILADRTGRRKGLVILAGLLQGLAAFGFFLVARMGALVAFALVFGLGYGAYLSSDWALAMAVLPDQGASGRDLGVWGTAYNLPPLVAGVVAGLLVPWVAAHASLGQGYRVLFLLTFAYYLAGSVLVTRVRSVS